MRPLIGVKNAPVIGVHLSVQRPSHTVSPLLIVLKTSTLTLIKGDVQNAAVKRHRLQTQRPSTTVLTQTVQKASG